MTASKIFSAIQKEFDQAILEQPRWSLDATQAGAMLMDKAGELMQATTDFHEGTSRRAGDMATSRQQMQEEAVKVGVMVLRFLLHIPFYEPKSTRVDLSHRCVKLAGSFPGAPDWWPRAGAVGHVLLDEMGDDVIVEFPMGIKDEILILWDKFWIPRGALEVVTGAFHKERPAWSVAGYPDHKEEA